MGSQFLQPIRDSEFLAAVKHRSAIPGGTCEFDLPDYATGCAGLQERVATRNWMKNLRPLCDSIAELWLLRERPGLRAVAVNGVYHHQLLGESISGFCASHCRRRRPLPEISGSHHRCTIRYMQWPDAFQRPRQTTSDVRFRLILCWKIDCILSVPAQAGTDHGTRLQRSAGPPAAVRREQPSGASQRSGCPSMPRFPLVAIHEEDGSSTSARGRHGRSG